MKHRRRRSSALSVPPPLCWDRKNPLCNPRSPAPPVWRNNEQVLPHFSLFSIVRFLLWLSCVHPFIQYYTLYLLILQVTRHMNLQIFYRNHTYFQQYIQKGLPYRLKYPSPVWQTPYRHFYSHSSFFQSYASNYTSFTYTALVRSPSSTISTSGKLWIYCLNWENP